jgi:hypothetical protein
MPDPLIVLGMNVRNCRMTFLVHGDVVLSRGIGLLSARRLGSLRGSRASCGYVPTANRCGMTASAWLPTAPPVLGKRNGAKQNQ